MNWLARGLVVALIVTAPLAAQERDPTIERIGLALQQPPGILRGGGATESALPKRVGIFTLVPPAGRGELIRVSVPIGDLVSRAFKNVAAANHRRQESSARRTVQAELRRREEQQASSRR